MRRGLFTVLVAGTAMLCWLGLVPATLNMHGAMDGLSAWMLLLFFGGVLRIIDIVTACAGSVVSHRWE